MRNTIAAAALLTSALLAPTPATAAPPTEQKDPVYTCHTIYPRMDSVTAFTCEETEPGTGEGITIQLPGGTPTFHCQYGTPEPPHRVTGNECEEPT